MFAYTHFVSNHLGSGGVVFALSDRIGGYSRAPFDSLNLAFHTGDNALVVQDNISYMLKHFGVLHPLCVNNRLAYMTQIHGIHCATLESLMRDQAQLPMQDSCKIFNVGEADVLLLTQKQIPAMVLVADCNPILFFDKVNNVAALIHAGRAGVFSRICSCALRQMGAAFGTRVQDVYAFVGAGIRKCCYEVKDDVIAALKEVCDDFSKYLYTRNNQHFLDLEAMLKEEFRTLGIYDCYFFGECTSCNTNFFSYRRDGITGRFALIAQLI